MFATVQVGTPQALFESFDQSFRLPYSLKSFKGAQTFRSLGGVAKATGDREETIKRFYVQTLKPGIGRNWFEPLARLKLQYGQIRGLVGEELCVGQAQQLFLF
jgi:hypothetical protein